MPNAFIITMDEEITPRLTKLIRVGMWNIPIACHAICPDGKVRKFRTAQSPDTYFSLPARGSIKGVSIRGYVTTRDDGEYEFRPYQNHPNYPRIV
jgi:hypothetical protein